jgi:GNAT superfamily N-acetyltransferase
MPGESAHSLSIGPASADDAVEIAALLTEAREALSQHRGRRRRAVRVESVRREIGRSLVLIGRVEGEIVATARLDRRKPWAARLDDFIPSPTAIYVHDVAVAPLHQRRGYGRGILNHVYEIARERKIKALRVDAYDAPWGAGEFYLRCGYVEVSRTTYRGVPLSWFERRVAF